MKLFIDVTSSCRSMQSAGMRRMTRKIFAELSRPTVQFSGIRSAIFIQTLVRRRAINAGVISRFRIADYNRISILSYKLL